MDLEVTVLYGSETGNAQDVAEQIWRSAKRQKLRSNLSALDDYDIEKILSEKLIVFVVSTTGQGDCPSNMKEFWRFLLRRNLPSSLLGNLRYGVLGLGDSSYQKFNFAAKKLDKRLAQLGAKELLPIGLADDLHDLGLDTVVHDWTQELWKNISSVYNISIVDIADNDREIIYMHNVSIVRNLPNEGSNYLCYSESDIYTQKALSQENVQIGIVTENLRTTTNDHFQDVRLLKIESQSLDYQPGDVVYARPKNSTKQVEKFFDVLHDNNVLLYPNMLICVSEKETRVPPVLEQNLSLGEIVTQYWDLNFKPRRTTFEILSCISENDLEKEKLCEFTTPDGQEELYNYVNRPRRNILEVLADFPHTTSKLTIRLLFEIMSPIKPRAFSIASSLKNTKTEIHILVAVVRYKTKLLEPRFGLCSNWLASLKCGDKISFWIKKATFVFAIDKPMILVGPGTGVAPFRSLLLEKAAINQDLSECLLFFGCRNKNKDYHCKQDFERLSKDRHLKLFSAFSRDQEHKIYVQHVIRENDKLCWDFLEKNANIYLAGNSKNMPDSVRDEFVKLAEKFGKLTNEEAEHFIKQLEKSNRYQCETWS